MMANDIFRIKYFQSQCPGRIRFRFNPKGGAHTSGMTENSDLRALTQSFFSRWRSIETMKGSNLLQIPFESSVVGYKGMGFSFWARNLFDSHCNAHNETTKVRGEPTKIYYS